MRQQERVHDNDVQLHGCDHEEGHDQESASDQEDLDQEEDECFYSGSLTFAHSVTARFAAPSRQAQQFGEST